MIRAMRSMTVCLVLGLAACHAHREPVAAAGARRYGDVMSEVGRRFERAGRDVASQRWELAAYDVGEMSEALESDLPAATPPPEVHSDLHPLATAFIGAHPAALRRSIEAHDRAAFDLAFARTAEACNGCHRTAGMAFIEIPSVVGASVPVVTAN